MQGTYNVIRVVRAVLMLAIIFLIYQAFKTGESTYTIAALVLGIVFFMLVKKHEKLNWEKRIKETLIEINDTEIAYISKGETPFQNGGEYIDSTHLYSYDLDVFGANSLYQNLNRTATYIGGNTLATRLLTLLSPDEIKANQLAIKELSSKLDWRQYIYAVGKVVEDTSLDYNRLMAWAGKKTKDINKIILALSYITPVLFILSVIAYNTLGGDGYAHIASVIFLLNIALMMTQLGTIRQVIVDSDRTTEILKKYGAIIEKIEQTDFESSKLKVLKSQFVTEGSDASTKIKKLSGLLSEIQNVMNPFGAILFNGAILYHIHTLNKILKWKNNHSADVERWLQSIGEIEALNSLANFYYNNPNFVFPELNQDMKMEMEHLGHPLIAADKRICNDLKMDANNFVILTGSNMSGKSTYLRTLGLNMILAGTGSAICAQKANVQPLPVIVSMRQSDSLSDGESYFFAEVKRLKKLLNEIQTKTCFVLLDEILKGTNSDDKQDGTIEVIKKIISYEAVGAIATHDLEVCQTTHDYPNKLTNKCFEVDIIEGNLVFDYKLRDGICQNKTATFLMRKEGVI